MKGLFTLNHCSLPDYGTTDQTTFISHLICLEGVGKAGTLVSQAIVEILCMK